MSFSSELSLFNDLPKHLPFHQPVAKTGDTSIESPPKGTENVLSKQPPDRSRLTAYCSEPVNQYEEEHSTSVDLDETLKFSPSFSPSLAKGMEFNDEEAWESFSHGSPQSRRRTESSGSDVTLSHLSPLSQSEVWRSPVKKEVLSTTAGCTAVRELDKSPAEGGRCAKCFEGSINNRDCITAVERHRVVETPGGSMSAHSRMHAQERTDFSDYHTTNLTATHTTLVTVAAAVMAAVLNRCRVPCLPLQHWSPSSSQCCEEWRSSQMPSLNAYVKPIHFLLRPPLLYRAQRETVGSDPSPPPLWHSART